MNTVFPVPFQGILEQPYLCYPETKPSKVHGLKVRKREVVAGRNPLEGSALNYLPDEILLSIFNHLNDAQSWSRLRQTNTYLYRLSEDKTNLNSLIKKESEDPLALGSPKTRLLNVKLKQAKQTGDSLTDLDLSESNVNDEMLEEVFEKCPHIQILDLTLCVKLIKPSFEKCLNLQKLNLSECTGLTDLVLNKLENLELISLEGCHHLKNFSLSKLSSHLSILSLTGCDSSLFKELSQLPCSLQSIDLSCTDLKDEDVGQLPRGLKILYVSHCENLTDNVTQKLPSELEILDLSKCQLTDGVINQLPKSLLSLKVSDTTISAIAINNYFKNSKMNDGYHEFDRS